MRHRSRPSSASTSTPLTPTTISHICPCSGLTAERFVNGYGSTVDSAETLVSISTATNGDLAAAVKFTSHQNPAASPDQKESCTDWSISLFLTQGGSGYLLDNPPPGYHATYQACP